MMGSKIGLAILLAIVIGLLASTDSPAQPTLSLPPTLKAGEYWIWKWQEDFRGVRSGTYRRTVVRKDTFEGQEVYILSRGDGTFNVVTLDFITIARIDGKGAVQSRTILRGENHFPLSVGRTYTREYDNTAGRYRGTYKYTVVGQEQIGTEAGTFQAFRVQEDGRGNYYDGSPFTEQGVLYFAPQAKQWVKYTYSVSTGYKYSEELTAYQVVPD